MRASLTAAALCAWLALGCGHAQVANDVPAEGKAAPDQKQEQGPGPKNDEAERTKRPAPPKAFAGESGLRLSTSPEGQLTPDGMALIRDRLRAEGEHPGDSREDTERALRASQGRHGLPATGVPDEATIRALGLDPAKVFRRKAE